MGKLSRTHAISQKFPPAARSLWAHFAQMAAADPSNKLHLVGATVARSLKGTGQGGDTDSTGPIWLLGRLAVLQRLLEAATSSQGRRRRRPTVCGCCGDSGSTYYPSGIAEKTPETRQRPIRSDVQGGVIPPGQPCHHPALSL